jgi:hypothetical protein
MARIFAQHADAGIYHLETRYCESNRWEWMIFEAGKKGVLFSGDAATLDEAKKKAAAAVGLWFVIWKDIGPSIDLPDS